MTGRAYVTDLRDAAAADIAHTGAKAANLARLIAAGFPVPNGIVLTTSALEAHIGGATLDSVDAARSIAEAPLPAPVTDALRSALATLGNVSVAVRSSGVKEDLAGASFAGQYATYLNVCGHDAVLEAVRNCWASVCSPQVLAYRSANRISAGGMAVLIQPMIAADTAGVAFSVNPVTGDPNEVVVSAVRGLGERLVSGLVSPDEWTVRDGRATCIAAPEGAIDADLVLAIADMARRVEHHFGTPQDIEWAVSSGRAWVLQARPITTLASPSLPNVQLPVEIPPGFWERDVSHFPLPLYPLERSVTLDSQTAAFSVVFGELSLLLDGLESREIGGWTYQRLIPPGGKDRAPPPGWVWWLLTRLAPPIRDRLRGCVAVVRGDTAGQWLDRWVEEWKPDLERRIAELRAVDLTALDDEALARHLGDTHQLRRDAHLVHFRLNGAIQTALADFAFVCRDLLGWSERETFDMLGGLSVASSAPATALSYLAGIVRGNAALRECLDAIDATTADKMSALDPVFESAFAAHQREFGCRTIRYETCDPTIAEMPALTLGLLRDQLIQPYDPERRAADSRSSRELAVAKARGTIARSRVEEAERFERVLARAERAYPIREEHGFYDWAAPAALMRYAALEIGARLAQRGQIPTVTDVFHLEMAELRRALVSRQPQADLITRRRGERAWALAQTPPRSYGKTPPPPPSFAALPPEARFVHEALMWTLDRVFAPYSSNRAQSGSDNIGGIAASGGRYTGPARVIRDETEFHRIRPGDVLVCPITSPVWSVLFPSVGALVTDSGGILSHSAIIAREYRIPAVVATGNCTELLQDGQIVTVDGSAGRVTLGSRRATGSELQ